MSLSRERLSRTDRRRAELSAFTEKQMAELFQNGVRSLKFSIKVKGGDIIKNNNTHFSLAMNSPHKKGKFVTTKTQKRRKMKLIKRNEDKMLLA